MQMLYNSDNFVVVQFDDVVPRTDDVAPRAEPSFELSPSGVHRPGGYEIVDKFARKEIFIQGELAAQFKLGVDALIEAGPTEEALDDFIGRYSSLMQQPVIVH